MPTTRAIVTATVGLSIAGTLAWTARTPDEGIAWRVAYVVTSLGGAGLLMMALRQWKPSARTVLTVAVLLRAVVFPLQPTLSDDGYRYVWDGMIQSQGIASPYAYSPADSELRDWHGTALYERMNSRYFYSVYPPLSQAVFALAGSVYFLGWEWSWYVIKAVTMLAELVGILALIRLVGPSGAALYAWHPLAVIEVAGQGHTEGLLVGALGLLLLTSRWRSAWAGVALACASWIKLYPFVMVPAVWVRGGRWTALVFVVVALALAVPYAGGEAVDHVRQSIGLYLGTFDFYSAPYRLVKSALHPIAGETAGAVAATSLSAIWLGWVSVLALTADGSFRSVRLSVVGVVVGYVLTASTLHPWHLLPLLWIGPLLQLRKPVLWFTTWSTATYLAYTWPSAQTAAIVIGWGGAAILLIGSLWACALRVLMRHRASGKWDRIETVLPGIRRGGRILDLGAGEGYVGDTAANALGLALTSVDVVDYAQSARRIDVYDGERLPYADGAFDATLIVFTLHHTDDPRAVLREAVRVTRGPVIVLETVYTPTVPKLWLERVDRWANRLRSGGSIEEEPLDIRTDAHWRQVFEDEGLRLEASRQWGGLHPQALYRLRGQGDTASSRDAAVVVRASSQSA